MRVRQVALLLAAMGVLVSGAIASPVSVVEQTCLSQSGESAAYCACVAKDFSAWPEAEQVFFADSIALNGDPSADARQTLLSKHQMTAEAFEEKTAAQDLLFTQIVESCAAGR
jgi:hypothetical protein